jgi:hypothetical protein
VTGIEFCSSIVKSIHLTSLSAQSLSTLVCLFVYLLFSFCKFCRLYSFVLRAIEILFQAVNTCRFSQVPFQKFFMAAAYGWGFLAIAWYHECGCVDELSIRV